MNWLGRVIQTHISKRDEVLDLGCGKGEVTNGLKCKKLVGVDIFREWMDEYEGEKICDDVRKVKFRENSFDVVLALDILEHLEKEEAIELIKKAERWARKKVILYTPKQFHLQDTLGNPYNQHKCLIPLKVLEDLGYNAKKIIPDFNVLAIKEI